MRGNRRSTDNTTSSAPAHVLPDPHYPRRSRGGANATACSHVPCTVVWQLPQGPWPARWVTSPQPMRCWSTKRSGPLSI